jgi:hypothetical protein
MLIAKDSKYTSDSSGEVCTITTIAQRAPFVDHVSMLYVVYTGTADTEWCMPYDEFLAGHDPYKQEKEDVH